MFGGGLIFVINNKEHVACVHCVLHCVPSSLAVLQGNCTVCDGRDDMNVSDVLDEKWFGHLSSREIKLNSSSLF